MSITLRVWVRLTFLSPIPQMVFGYRCDITSENGITNLAARPIEILADTLLVEHGSITHLCYATLTTLIARTFSYPGHRDNPQLD